nr:uncharacterized protein LOC117685513 [Crassostrea gigas]
MYNFIGRSNNKLLIIVCITTLCLRCYGTISNLSTTTNWANAQMHCREEGKMLPNMPIHMLSNESYFWTGHYTRLSEWIKIIGCFEESVVNTLTKKSHEMYFPSAGRCQEVCLASNFSVFGVQFNTCVCLEKIPGQRSRGSKNCSSTCSWNYPTGTNITFQNYCGGHKTYSLFKSGSEMETFAFTTENCLAIQCSKYDKTFLERRCDNALAQICNKTCK